MYDLCIFYSAIPILGKVATYFLDIFLGLAIAPVAPEGRKKLDNYGAIN